MKNVFQTFLYAFATLFAGLAAIRTHGTTSYVIGSVVCLGCVGLYSFFVEEVAETAAKSLSELNKKTEDALSKLETKNADQIRRFEASILSKMNDIQNRKGGGIFE